MKNSFSSICNQSGQIRGRTNYQMQAATPLCGLGSKQFQISSHDGRPRIQVPAIGELCLSVCNQARPHGDTGSRTALGPEQSDRWRTQSNATPTTSWLPSWLSSKRLKVDQHRPIKPIRSTDSMQRKRQRFYCLGELPAFIVRRLLARCLSPRERSATPIPIAQTRSVSAGEPRQCRTGRR